MDLAKFEPIADLISRFGTKKPTFCSAFHPALIQNAPTQVAHVKHLLVDFFCHADVEFVLQRA